MSNYGPKAKKRSFEELALTETWFQFGDGRALALRRMKLDSSPAVYAALERAIDEAGDPNRIDGLVELARMFCFAPRPSLYIRLRRLLGLSDFSARTLARRVIPMADRAEFEKWLVSENRDIDVAEYRNTKLAEVKKNVDDVLLVGFATEMSRIKAETKNWPPEISAQLRSFFLRDASEVSGGRSA